MHTGLHSSHFQVLRRLNRSLHSIWHTIRNQPPAQPEDFQIMGHSGNDMTSTNGVMAGLKWSAICSFQDYGCHLQVLWECLQDYQETIQSIHQYLPGLCLLLDLLVAHLGDPQLASQQNNSSGQPHCWKQKSLGLQTSRYCRRYHKTKRLPIMRAIILLTCTVEKANAKSAWSKLKSPWSNVPKGWGRPTAVCSTSGKKYGWLVLWRRSISPVSRGRNIWNSFKMDPSTWRLLAQIFRQHSRTDCHWIILIMLNGFGGSGLRCFGRNVQGKFGRLGTREVDATSDQWQIWQRAWAKKLEVTSQSCQIQQTWLWFTGCRTATIIFYPPNISKPGI